MQAILPNSDGTGLPPWIVLEDEGESFIIGVKLTRLPTPIPACSDASCARRRAPVDPRGWLADDARKRRRYTQGLG